MGRHRSKDILDALRLERWTLKGPNRLIKVVKRLPTGSRPIGEVQSQYEMGGYVTKALHLRKMTPIEMERALGLPDGELAFGAVIYSFRRLPSITEIDYELSAAFSDGQAFTFMSDANYKPGDPNIHQWCIVAPNGVPVDLSSQITLEPGQQFPG